MTRALVVVLSGLASTGCAALFAEKRAAVFISSQPEGAEILIDGRAHWGRTPARVELERDHTPNVSLVLPGYQMAQCYFRTQVVGMWVALDLLLFWPGAIVDGVTGAWNEVTPSTCDVTLEPGSGDQPPIYQVVPPPPAEVPPPPSL